MIYPIRTPNMNKIETHINITLSITEQSVDSLKDVTNGCFSPIGQF